MDDKQLDSLVFWLAFSRLKGLGSEKFEQLKQLSAEKWELLQHNAQGWLSQLGIPSKELAALTAPQSSFAEKAIRWLERSDQHSIVTLADADYSERLRGIASPPRLLFAKGNLELLSRHQLAIVGSRQPSVSGKNLARQFSAQLSQSGWVITSGLAAGVDGCAHLGALDAGGQTIAVLGSGIDVIYPKRHKQLYHDILANDGLILSEFAPTTEAKAQHFPRRNRIISGLSHGVLVVEAAIKSGSLISAKYALQQGREVFAIPGSIHNPMSQGCHWLIQQGAKLTTQVEDILEEFPYVSAKSRNGDEKNLVKKQDQNLASDVLLDSVDYEATSIDEVVQRSGLPLSTVLAQLLEYELRGLVASVSGGYVKLGGN